MNPDTQRTPHQRAPEADAIALDRGPTTEVSVHVENDADELVQDYLSDVLAGALHKLIPDSALEQDLQDVKVDAVSRALKEEPDSKKGNFRSAFLPLMWFATSGLAIDDSDSECQAIQQYMVTYSRPDTSSVHRVSRVLGLVAHHRIPRKLFASFCVGGIVGALIPTALIIFNGALEQYVAAWTVAFAVFVAVAAIGVAILTWFTLRTVFAMESVEVRLTSDEGEVAVVRTRRRVGRPTLVFPHGTPVPAESQKCRRAHHASAVTESS